MEPQESILQHMDMFVLLILASVAGAIVYSGIRLLQGLFNPAKE